MLSPTQKSDPNVVSDIDITIVDRSDCACLLILEKRHVVNALRKMFSHCMLIPTMESDPMNFIQNLSVVLHENRLARFYQAVCLIAFE